jgi:hypothetical protein
MDAGIATQLITVGATLGGVVLTLAASAQLENRRAREARALEALRLTSEDSRWLRDRRVEAYAGLSLAAEEGFQFMRTQMPVLTVPDGDRRLDEISARWAELLTGLRKAYNQVALFGAADARTAAQQIWRTARDGGNDYLRDLDARPDRPADLPALSDQIWTAASLLSTAAVQFLETCRTDLQGHEADAS